jgi:hypothetical protein
MQPNLTYFVAHGILSLVRLGTVDEEVVIHVRSRRCDPTTFQQNSIDAFPIRFSARQQINQ